MKSPSTSNGNGNGNRFSFPVDPSPSTIRRLPELISKIKDAADKLEKDQTDEGDLKILNRAIRELRYAFKVFSKYRNERKVTVFGSARTRPEQPAYQQAVQFGKQMADSEWMVITGASSGIMEAGHVGAGRDHALGLNIMLPFEQGANHIIEGDPKLVNMKYFFTRKLMFVKECDAVVMLPGGFGTLDEGFEVLTLLQTGKCDLMPVVFLDEPGGSFWKDWEHFVQKRLLGDGMISPDDLSLFKVTDNVDEAVTEVLNFYQVYHSMRYVKNKMVLRLKQSLTDSFLEGIKHHFADILEDGTFTQRPLFSEEAEEVALADLPRLVFHFNRRSLARLRMMIDCINAGNFNRIGK